MMLNSVELLHTLANSTLWTEQQWARILDLVATGARPTWMLTAEQTQTAIDALIGHGEPTNAERALAEQLEART